ncbi:MAG: amidohydrolase family protein [Gemmatimonadetes bacterium]|nr:amidohydrolase family protein [Gemmatimonadota bacterium]MYG36113.1 amidohydrolase family protein [Gemmatimonadota bacterium]
MSLDRPAAPFLWAAFLATAVLPAPALAQDAAGPDGSDDADWDVTLARGDTREIDFETDEGTWMSVDMSPDGRWIIFDLLAHVYRVPAEGGQAESLTQESGVAVNYHPKYSPDGTRIAFISDRAGQTNLWVMDADGSNPRQVQSSMDTRVTMPEWTADGEYILVAQSGGIWMYHQDGGTGVEVVSNDDGSASWPSVSEDGRYVFYHVRTPGQTVPWAVDDIATALLDDRLVRDAFQGTMNLRRMDLETGAVVKVTSGVPSRQYRLSGGGGFAGEISPDGRHVAFARRLPDATIEWKGHEFGPSTALWVRDLETGAERIAMDPIAQDMTEGMKTIRMLPGYAWAPDGASIVIAQGGKLRRLDVASGEVSTIPFTARVHRVISEQAYQAFRIDDGPVPINFTRWTTGSHDGERLAFVAAGRVWVMDLPDGTPRRLTSDTGKRFEYSPSWSPDSRSIAYTTVDENGTGHVMTIGADGGSPRQVSAEPGEYAHTQWSPDGTEILATRGSGATVRYRSVAHNPWYDLVLFPAAGPGGGAETGDQAGMGSAGQRVVRVPGNTLPTRTQFVRGAFGPDGRIFYRTMGDSTRLRSVARDGSDPRTHLVLPWADEVMISPDGRHAAFNEGDNAYLVPVPSGAAGLGGAVAVAKKGGMLPVRQLSRRGGIFPGWRDARTVEFGSAASYYTHDVASETTDTFQIALEVPRGSLGMGTVAITGARIITLENRQVIENGTLVATDGRITCVGTMAECDAAGADHTIDGTGKTVIPGFIDMHSHFFREYRGIIPPNAFEMAVALAYGVTSNLDNSQWSQDVFPAAQMIEAGVLVGPRTYTTGDPLYRGDAGRQNELTSYEVAEDNIARLQSWGAVSLKQYLQPRRDQRQWVSDIARKRGLMVTSEGSDLAFNMGMIMDGQTAWEHPISYVPMYSDAARFFGRAETVYSPTFVVGGPGPWNDEWFFQETEVWRDEKLRLWMPWKQLVPHSRRVFQRPFTDYSYPMLAQILADWMAEGARGAIGAHGQQHGLASHWEVWIAESAMGPMGALELASVEGAYFLGASEDLGTLTPGKLADLMVLNSNPLDNIRNTTDIMLVMKGGIVYDGMTLDELWPTERPYGARPWVHEEVWRSGPRPVNR